MWSKMKKILKFFIKFVMRFFALLPLDTKKVVFSSFSGRSYSDNPKYIAEEIVRQNLDLDCVFVLEHPEKEKLPEGIRSVKYNTIQYLYEVATAKIWVDNTRKQPHILKKANQIYIQTWHGSIAIKKIEKDAIATLDDSYVQTAIKDSKNIDYLITNGQWGEALFKRCFWYDEGKILKLGSPRVDMLFDDNYRLQKKIRDSLNVDPNKKILLYAPTFRKDKNMDVYKINYNRVVETLKSRFSGDWCVLIKLHPNIKELAGKMMFLCDDVIDVSQYSDINELYTISNVLITDYSSSIFDFAITRKPAFIFACDLEEYLTDRDTYFDVKSLPFPFAMDNDQLERNILKFDVENYHENLDEFYNKLGLVEDGHASKRVVELIKKHTI